MKAVYLDMDGVLTALAQHTYREAGVPEDLVEDAFNDTVEWDTLHVVLNKYLGTRWTKQSVWDFWEAGGAKFWADIPWTSHGRALFELCSRYAPVVLMSTPTIHPSCAAGKIEWIKRCMPRGDQRRYALTPCKHHLAHPGALLVDDSEKNTFNFAKHGGEVFLWPGPHNANRHLAFDSALVQVEELLGSLERAG